MTPFLSPLCNVASLSLETQKSKNYALDDGTLEKYNENTKKELTLVWDTTTNGYRDATEREKGDPSIDKASAMKWGAYSNTDNKGKPACLIDLKTFKGAHSTSTFQLSAVQASTTRPGEATDHQNEAESEPETEEEVDYNTWANMAMMEHEMTYEYSTQQFAHMYASNVQERYSIGQYRAVTSPPLQETTTRDNGG